MKNNHLNKILITLLVSGVITACSSGSSGANSSSTTPQTSTLQGPINTENAIQEINSSYATKSYTSKKLTGSSLGTFFSLVSGGGSAFVGAGKMFKQINAWSGNAPVDPLTLINKQLAEMQNTLDEMQKTLNATDGTLVNFVRTQAKNTSNNYFYQLKSIDNEVGIYTGYGATFDHAMNNQSIESAANNMTTVRKLNALLTDMKGNNYGSTLQDISNNSKISVNDGWATMQVASKSDVTNSTISLAYASLYAQLQTLLPENLTNSNQNLIDLISQYNQEVMQVYLDNLVNLQIMYNIETTINYMNYLSPYSGELVNTLLEPPSAVVKPGDSESKFVSAQSNLTALYAQRVNAAFNTAMYWTISDPILPNQQGIIQNGAESYAKFINQNIPAKTLVGSIYATNGTGVNRVPGGQWIESANLYQSPYLGTFYQCQQAIDKNQVSPQNCGSLLGNQYSASFNGANITVYDQNNNLSHALDPLQYCGNLYESANYSNLYSTWNNNGTPILQCNISKTSNYTIKTTPIDGTNLQKSQSDAQIVDPGWLPTTTVTFGTINGPIKTSYVTISPGHYPETLGPIRGDFNIYLSPSSIVPVTNFALINGNNHYFLRTNPFSLYNGGFGGRAGSDTAGMQVTLPNGFILPFYILTYSRSFANDSSQPSIQLVCPAANSIKNEDNTSYQNMLVPNLISCQGSTLGDAGMKVQTSDGSTYNVSIKANGRQQAFLSVLAN